MGHPYGAPAGYATAAVARRRRKWPWVLLGVLVTLVALFVVADRVALSLAEKKAGESLQSSQGLSSRPDVSVAGFPFLTQLLNDEFDDVTITADDISVGQGAGLTIHNLTVHLHHVTVPSDYSSVRARTATAQGRIDFADLSRAIGIRVTGSDNGRVVANPQVTIAGQNFHAPVSAEVHASSRQGITFTDVKVAGVSLPAAAAQGLAAAFHTAVSLAGLPFHVQVTGASVTSDGLVLRLSGRDLVYNR